MVEGRFDGNQFAVVEEYSVVERGHQRLRRFGTGWNIDRRSCVQEEPARLVAFFRSLAGRPDGNAATRYGNCYVRDAPKAVSDRLIPKMPCPMDFFNPLQRHARLEKNMKS
jgi:hypothetical protein